MLNAVIAKGKCVCFAQGGRGDHVPSTKTRGTDPVDLPEGWKLFYYGMHPAVASQAGVILIMGAPTSLGGTITALKLRLSSSIITDAVLQVYATNGAVLFLLDTDMGVEVELLRRQTTLSW